MRLYQTPSMELAIPSMAARHHKSMIFSRYKTIRKIRFQFGRMTPDMAVTRALSWRPECAAIVEDWQRRGGVIEYRPHTNNFKKMAAPGTDAMLITECPLQYPTYEHIVANVTQEVVVYRPPTWELHEEVIDALYPNAASYIALYAIMQGFKDREGDDVQEGCRRLAPFTATVFSAWDIEQLLGWKETRLRYILANKFLHTSRRFHIFSTRIAPENQDLRWAYDILKQQAEVTPGNYAMRIGHPLGPYIPGFQRMLARLLRECYVVREDCVYLVDPTFEVDYEKVEAANNFHRGRWYKTKALIDSANEYEL